MSVTNYPKVLKYTVGDRPFTYANKNDNYSFVERGTLNGRSTGICKRVIVTGWRAVVSLSNGAAVQTNYYTVKEIIGYSSENYLTAVELYSDTEFEISSTKLFCSPNHLISTIKGKYINSPYGDLTDDANLYFSKIGNFAFNTASNGDWIDWAGMNFKDMDFSEFVFNGVWIGGYVGGEAGGTKTLIIDNCNLEGAILPAGYTTRTAFRNLLFSYDKRTTIFSDGYPIGKGLSGTVAGSMDGSTVTGTSTAFLTNLSVGDQIVIGSTGVFTVTEVTTDTSLKVAETFTANFTGKTISSL